MIEVKEVVFELSADGFMNSGGVTGRVLCSLSSGMFSCASDRIVRRVSFPEDDYSTAEEARSALIDYWQRCDEKLTEPGNSFIP